MKIIRILVLFLGCSLWASAQNTNGWVSCLTPLTSGSLTVRCAYLPSDLLAALGIGGGADLVEIAMGSTDTAAIHFHVSIRLENASGIVLAAERASNVVNGQAVERFTVAPDSGASLTSLVIDAVKVSSSISVVGVAPR